MEELLPGQFDGFITGAEAARVCGVDASTFVPGREERWWMTDIHYVVVAGHYYYLRTDVEKAARDRKAWKRRNAERNKR